MCWSSAMVLWRMRECVLVECHGTVEDEGMCVGRVPWYCGGVGNVCWSSAMVLWRRRECVLVECHGTVEEEGMCVGRVPWYCGGGGNVCWSSAMVLWRRRECVLVECHGAVEEEVEQSALNFEVHGGNLSAGRMSLGHRKTLLEGGERSHIQGQLGSILHPHARKFVFLAKPLATHPSTWVL